MKRKVILKGCGLKKSFPGTKGRIEVLRGLDLEVFQGEVVAILGASGVGKSTLLHILGTLDIPDDGNLEILGENVYSLREKELNRMRSETVGFIFQFHHLLPDFTAIENVMMPLLIAGKGPGIAKENAARLLNEVGLGERLHHRPSELSGGEQQRVAVARAFANNPEIILADEPTGNLDEASSESVNKIILDLARKEAKTFVVVSHNKDFYNIADRAFLLQEGVLQGIEGENVDPM